MWSNKGILTQKSPRISLRMPLVGVALGCAMAFPSTEKKTRMANPPTTWMKPTGIIIPPNCFRGAPITIMPRTRTRTSLQNTGAVRAAWST